MTGGSSAKEASSVSAGAVVVLPGTKGAQAEVLANKSAAGAYPLVVGYSNNSGSTISCELLINGKVVQTLSFPTGTNKTVSADPVALLRDNNTLSLQSGGGGKELQLDYFDLGNNRVDPVATLPPLSSPAAAARKALTVRKIASSYLQIDVPEDGTLHLYTPRGRRFFMCQVHSGRVLLAPSVYRTGTVVVCFQGVHGMSSALFADMQ